MYLLLWWSLANFVVGRREAYEGQTRLKDEVIDRRQFYAS